MYDAVSLGQQTETYVSGATAEPLLSVVWTHAGFGKFHQTMKPQNYCIVSQLQSCLQLLVFCVTLSINMTKTSQFAHVCVCFCV